MGYNSQLSEIVGYFVWIYMQSVTLFNILATALPCAAPLIYQRQPSHPEGKYHETAPRAEKKDY